MDAKGQQWRAAKDAKILSADKRPGAVGFASKEPADLELSERQQRLDLQTWLPSFVAWLLVPWLVFVVVVTVLAGVDKLNYHASVLVTELYSTLALRRADCALGFAMLSV